jgi:flagellar hook-basal body complex protein FliE
MISALQIAHVAGTSPASGFDSLLKAGGSDSGNSPFGDLLKDAVSKVSQLEDQARNTVNGLMTGSGVDVHQAMIASEKASMAFELALAVRNKAIQSYQSVMSMQF